MLDSWRSLHCLRGPCRPETDRPAARPKSRAALPKPGGTQDSTCSNVDYKFARNKEHKGAGSHGTEDARLCVIDLQLLQGQG